MTSEEYLMQAKGRALHYLDQGDTEAAIESLVADLSAEAEFRLHAEVVLKLFVAGLLDDQRRLRHWIIRFH